MGNKGQKMVEKVGIRSGGMIDMISPVMRKKMIKIIARKRIEEITENTKGPRLSMNPKIQMPIRKKKKIKLNRSPKSNKRDRSFKKLRKNFTRALELLIKPFLLIKIRIIQDIIRDITKDIIKDNITITITITEIIITTKGHMKSEIIFKINSTEMINTKMILFEMKHTRKSLILSNLKPKRALKLNSVPFSVEGSKE